jgi:hypothetical protein
MSGMSIGHIPWSFGEKLLHEFSSVALDEMKISKHNIINSHL